MSLDCWYYFALLNFLKNQSQYNTMKITLKQKENSLSSVCENYYNQ